MRGKAKDNLERRSANVQDTERAKKQARDLVLEDRSPPSQTLPPAVSVAKSPSPNSKSARRIKSR